MNVATALREARTTARLTQRQLAARAGVPQSTVARIERGRLMPRVDLFDDLLRAADQQVTTQPRPGVGIDRSHMRELLGLTPDERLRIAVASANNLAELMATMRPAK